jgi:hypothetical protein
MAIGFIPFAGDEDEAAEDDRPAHEETWARDEVLRLHGDLFEQVRRYAALWERIDPGNHNADQELSKVMVALGHAQSWQERLEVLRTQAQRLMVGAAQAKTDDGLGGHRGRRLQPSGWPSPYLERLSPRQPSRRSDNEGNAC